MKQKSFRVIPKAEFEAEERRAKQAERWAKRQAAHKAKIEAKKVQQPKEQA